MKSLLSLGFLLVFLGIVLIIIASLQGQKASVKTAGGVFLGPIPVLGFANERKLLYTIFGLGVLIFIIFRLLRN